MLKGFSFVTAEHHIAAIACQMVACEALATPTFLLSFFFTQVFFSLLNGTFPQQRFANSRLFVLSLFLNSPPGGHPVLDLCGMVRRTRRIKVVKAGQTSRLASGAPVALSTTVADALRVVANPARKPRRPRQEVTHLQRKRPLPRPSRVGLSRKEPAHRHLPSFTIVRVSVAAEAKH